ncbi:hypothetical protein BZA70DRAFT_277832 [Myxozyma melibiosi]|uniref:t-SNARE coiled-coil homology domain-containing protein n=1 Tax=Myxozyma melibiosi TaxID=54550 RepID=A0ABR1F648_9ASCO
MYSDPYDDIAREVDQQLTVLRPQSQAYVTSLTSPSPSAGPTPATPTLEQLASTLDEIDLSLQDLRESVDAVEKSPEQFGLTLEQVEDRSRFVAAREEEVARIRNQIEAATRGRKPRQDFTAVQMEDRYGGSSGRQTPRSDYDVEMEREQQALLIADQDQQLDSVMNTVQNLRDQAAVMGNELEEHVELLQDLDQRVDRTQGKIDLAMNRVKYILKKNEERASNCCILMLTIVLFILLFIVLFM